MATIVGVSTPVVLTAVVGLVTMGLLVLYLRIRQRRLQQAVFPGGLVDETTEGSATRRAPAPATLTERLTLLFTILGALITVAGFVRDLIQR